MNKLLLAGIISGVSVFGSCGKEEPSKKPERALETLEQKVEVSEEFTKKEESVYYLEVIPVGRNEGYVNGYVLENKKENIEKFKEFLELKKRLGKRFRYLDNLGRDVSADKKYNELEKRISAEQFSLHEFKGLVRGSYYQGEPPASGVILEKDLDRYKELFKW